MNSAAVTAIWVRRVHSAWASLAEFAKNNLLQETSRTDGRIQCKKNNVYWRKCERFAWLRLDRTYATEASHFINYQRFLLSVNQPWYWTQSYASNCFQKPCANVFCCETLQWKLTNYLVNTAKIMLILFLATVQNYHRTPVGFQLLQWCFQLLQYVLYCLMRFLFSFHCVVRRSKQTFVVATSQVFYKQNIRYRKWTLRQFQTSL